jgi:hypothetical protein
MQQPRQVIEEGQRPLAASPPQPTSVPTSVPSLASSSMAASRWWAAASLAGEGSAHQQPPPPPQQQQVLAPGLIQVMRDPQLGSSSRTVRRAGYASLRAELAKAAAGTGRCARTIEIQLAMLQHGQIRQLVGHMLTTEGSIDDAEKLECLVLIADAVRMNVDVSSAVLWPEGQRTAQDEGAPAATTASGSGRQQDAQPAAAGAGQQAGGGGLPPAGAPAGVTGGGEGGTSAALLPALVLQLRSWCHAPVLLSSAPRYGLAERSLDLLASAPTQNLFWWTLAQMYSECLPEELVRRWDSVSQLTQTGALREVVAMLTILVDMPDSGGSAARDHRYLLLRKVNLVLLKWSLRDELRREILETEGSCVSKLLKLVTTCSGMLQQSMAGGGGGAIGHHGDGAPPDLLRLRGVHVCERMQVEAALSAAMLSEGLVASNVIQLICNELASINLSGHPPGPFGSLSEGTGGWSLQVANGEHRQFGEYRSTPWFLVVSAAVERLAQNSDQHASMIKSDCLDTLVQKLKGIAEWKRRLQSGMWRPDPSSPDWTRHMFTVPTDARPGIDSVISPDGNAVLIPPNHVPGTPLEVVDVHPSSYHYGVAEVLASDNLGVLGLGSLLMPPGAYADQRHGSAAPACRVDPNGSVAGLEQGFQLFGMWQLAAVQSTGAGAAVPQAVAADATVRRLPRDEVSELVSRLSVQGGLSMFIAVDTAQVLLLEDICARTLLRMSEDEGVIRSLREDATFLTSLEAICQEGAGGLQLTPAEQAAIDFMRSASGRAGDPAEVCIQQAHENVTMESGQFRTTMQMSPKERAKLRGTVVAYEARSTKHSLSVRVQSMRSIRSMSLQPGESNRSMLLMERESSGTGRGYWIDARVMKGDVRQEAKKKRTQYFNIEIEAEGDLKPRVSQKRFSEFVEFGEQIKQDFGKRSRRGEKFSALLGAVGLRPGTGKFPAKGWTSNSAVKNSTVESRAARLTEWLGQILCLLPEVTVMGWLGVYQSELDSINNYCRATKSPNAADQQQALAISQTLAPRIVNCTLEEGVSLLSLAVKADNHDVAQILLSRQADVEFADFESMSTCLHEARSGRVAQLLLLNSARSDAQTIDGSTPCHVLCCKPENLEVVQFLLQQGNSCVVPNQQNQLGQTCLHLAASIEIAKALFTHGFSKTLKDNRGVAPKDRRDEVGRTIKTFNYTDQIQNQVQNQARLQRKLSQDGQDAKRAQQQLKLQQQKQLERHEEIIAGIIQQHEERLRELQIELDRCDPLRLDLMQERLKEVRDQRYSANEDWEPQPEPEPEPELEPKMQCMDGTALGAAEPTVAPEPEPESTLALMPELCPEHQTLLPTTSDGTVECAQKPSEPVLESRVPKARRKFWTPVVFIPEVSQFAEYIRSKTNLIIVSYINSETFDTVCTNWVESDLELREAMVSLTSYVAQAVSVSAEHDAAVGGHHPRQRRGSTSSSGSESGSVALTQLQDERNRARCSLVSCADLLRAATIECDALEQRMQTIDDAISRHHDTCAALQQLNYSAERDIPPDGEDKSTQELYQLFIREFDRWVRLHSSMDYELRTDEAARAMQAAAAQMILADACEPEKLQRRAIELKEAIADEKQFWAEKQYFSVEARAWGRFLYRAVTQALGELQAERAKASDWVRRVQEQITPDADAEREWLERVPSLEQLMACRDAKRMGAQKLRDAKNALEKAEEVVQYHLRRHKLS